MTETRDTGGRPARAPSGGAPRAAPGSVELYRDPGAARVPAEDTPVSALGVDPVTLARLARCGIVSLGQLRQCSVELLWRRIGRHGVADVSAQMERIGVPFGPLPDVARWRLGVLPREAACVPITPDTPVADLWPCLGRPVVDALERLGLRTLVDLAPASDDAVRPLYRLGRSHLRRIRALLQAAAEGAGGEARIRLEHGVHHIRRHETGRPRGGVRRPAPADGNP